MDENDHDPWIPWHFETVDDGDGPQLLMPGSPRSVARGCLCDPVRNNHGYGWRDDDAKEWGHILDSKCPLHRIIPPPPGHPALDWWRGVEIPPDDQPNTPDNA